MFCTLICSPHSQTRSHIRGVGAKFPPCSRTRSLRLQRRRRFGLYNYEPGPHIHKKERGLVFAITYLVLYSWKRSLRPGQSLTFAFANLVPHLRRRILTYISLTQLVFSQSSILSRSFVERFLSNLGDSKVYLSWFFERTHWYGQKLFWAFVWGRIYPKGHSLNLSFYGEIIIGLISFILRIKLSPIWGGISTIMRLESFCRVDFRIPNVGPTISFWPNFGSAFEKHKFSVITFVLTRGSIFLWLGSTWSWFRREKLLESELEVHIFGFELGYGLYSFGWDV